MPARASFRKPVPAEGEAALAVPLRTPVGPGTVNQAALFQENLPRLDPPFGVGDRSSWKTRARAAPNIRGPLFPI